MNRILTLVAGSLVMLSSSTVYAGGDAHAGKEKSAPCAACHGADGNSPAPEFPSLAGQHADYIVQALQDYKLGKRKNVIMAGFAANLNQQDREDLGAFYASQKGRLITIELY